ncbi:MAG: S16 family serine protease [Sulfolobales archaeon]
MGEALKLLAISFAMLLVSPLAFSHFDICFGFSNGLCRYLGEVEKCVDVLVYSAGVAKMGGKVLGYPIEVLLAVTRGSGAVFIHAEPLVDETFMLFARVAALVASTAVGAEFYKYNYFVLIKSPTARAQGPSLSAALGAGFALAILGVNVREPIAITGILMPDGSIGPVGHLTEKIVALSSLVKKVFVPAGNLVSVVINGTVMSLADFGRTLGLEVVEVHSIDEVLKHLGIGGTLIRQYVEEPQASSKVIREMEDYLSEAIKKGLADVATVCDERVASKLATEFEYISREVLEKPLVRNSTYAVGRLFSLLVRVETEAWNCSIRKGYSNLGTLASRALERLKSAESACYFYSKTSKISIGSAIPISTACWFLLDSWEEFNMSASSSLSLERRIFGLVKSARVADAVFVALDLLSMSDGLSGGVNRLEVDLKRLQLLLDYASALVDSLGEVKMPDLLHNRSASILRRYLHVGASLLASNSVMSLVYVLKVLHELLLRTYYSQYADLHYVTEISRTRATAFAISSGDPAIYALMRLGDSCVDSFEDLTDCSGVYLKAATLGFVLRYLLMSEAVSSQSYVWQLLPALAASAVSFIAVVLLLRKVRVFFSRTSLHLGLQRLTQPRTRVARR